MISAWPLLRQVEVHSSWQEPSLDREGPRNYGQNTAGTWQVEPRASAPWPDLREQMASSVRVVQSKLCTFYLSWPSVLSQALLGWERWKFGVLGSRSYLLQVHWHSGEGRDMKPEGSYSRGPWFIDGLVVPRCS